MNSDRKLIGICLSQMHATHAESGSIRGELLAGERLMPGNENSRFIVTGGNFRAFSDTAAGPVSPAGDPPALRKAEGGSF